MFSSILTHDVCTFGYFILQIVLQDVNASVQAEDECPKANDSKGKNHKLSLHCNWLCLLNRPYWSFAVRAVNAGFFFFFRNIEKSFELRVKFESRAKFELKGKYHENLLSFQNPKMFDCQQKQRNNCQVC